MSQVFDKPIVVEKKDDGSFMVSVRVSDSAVIVIPMERAEIERLYAKLTEELKEE